MDAKMKLCLSTLLICTSVQFCRSDTTVLAPTPGPPSVDSSSSIPFAVLAPQTLRFQQVYNASLFSTVSRDNIYITSLTVGFASSYHGFNSWTVTNMQVNLSTTHRAVDDLSTNFSANIGADEVVVFGPNKHAFNDTVSSREFPILLDKPFRYNSTGGNLLVDVRIFVGTSPFQFGFPPPLLKAQNSLTDETSIVFAGDVTAANASTTDTTGLLMAIQFSPVPSLRIEVLSVFGTNRPVLLWPSQPSVFVLESSPSLGGSASWHTVTGDIFGDERGPDRALYLPAPPPGPAGFYRLIWKSGQ